MVVFFWSLTNEGDASVILPRCNREPAGFTSPSNRLLISLARFDSYTPSTKTNPSLGLDVSGGGMDRLRKSPTLRVLRLRRWTHPHDPRWRDEHCLPIGHRSLPIHPEPANKEPLPVIGPPLVISHQSSELVLSLLIFGRFSGPPPRVVWYDLTAMRGGGPLSARSIPPEHRHDHDRGSSRSMRIFMQATQTKCSWHVVDLNPCSFCSIPDVCSARSPCRGTRR